MSSSCMVLTTETGKSAKSRNIYVRSSYPYYTGNGSADRPYRTIQGAIDLANEGDTIYVFEGRYNETLRIYKRVSIVGLDRKNITIERRGDNPRYIVEVTADYVDLEDLNFSDSKANARVAIVYLHSNYVTLQGVHIRNAHTWGLYLDSSNDNTIGNNIISNGKGVYSYYSNNNVFSNNWFKKNTDTTLRLVHTQNAILYNNTFNNTIAGLEAEECSNLNISNNKFGNITNDGIKLSGGSTNLVKSNIINRCNGNGIYVSSSSSTIQSNTLLRNQVGINLMGSNNQVKSNKIKYSTIWGIYAGKGTQNNLLFANRFILNKITAKDEGHNQWYSTNNRGNYWDDYPGVDRNLDKIGDTSYSTNGLTDLYPLGYFPSPPYKPTGPVPQDGKDNVGLTVRLRVNVSDPIEKPINIFFYNAKDNTLLGEAHGIPSGSNGSYILYLPFQTTFAWYAIANNSKLQNRSNIWIFTTKSIPPTNKKPVAKPGGPYTTGVGTPLKFDASGSYDPDGKIDFYRWNFGDGSSEILSTKPTHTYSDSGIYKIILTVVDNDGRTSTNTTNVTVGAYAPNKNPVAVAGGPYTVEVKKSVLFNASGSYDTDGTIASYRWDFGDNTTGNGVIVSHTYSKAKTYQVTLNVTDNKGGTNQAFVTVLVKPAKGFPGFELFGFIAALFVVLLWRKQKRKTL